LASDHNRAFVAAPLRPGFGRMIANRRFVDTLRFAIPQQGWLVRTVAADLTFVRIVEFARTRRGVVRGV
jgi:hypothetical protein